MIYADLFFAFLQIGAFSFGGGYGMIPMIREQCVSRGWLTEAELINFIAVAESTPGPLAVNIATFVGSSQGGLWGSLAATVGVVLPAFIIILLISAALNNLLRYRGVQAALSGVQPVVIGLICATGAAMLISTLAGISVIGDAFSVDWRNILIFLALPLAAFLYRHFTKRGISPISLILLSALLGILLFG